MEFIEIKDLNKAEKVRDIYETSFPPEEKVDFYSLFDGVFKNFKMFSVKDNNNIVAMFHFIKTKEFIHLNYLAVEEKFRGKSYGSSIINWLKKEYNHMPIVVDVEELQSSAKNSLQRIKRKKFYLKNGFTDGEYVFDWEGTFMTYLHYGKINSNNFMKYIQQIFPTIINVRKK